MIESAPVFRQTGLSRVARRECADGGSATIVGWGWLPALSLFAAFGVLSVALAYTASRGGAPGSVVLFWSGLLVMVVPAGIRLLAADATRQERLGLVVLVGLALYLVRVLHDPVAFSFHDEFLHWHTADDILRTGRLFHPNSLLPVSPLYPGFENVTASLAGVSGISIYVAGILVVGASRIVLMLALYLFYEQIGGSQRLAGIAVLLYATNSGFVFFDAQFSYESMALPLAVFALYLVARWLWAPQSRGTAVALGLALPAVVISHHLTTYALVGILLLWTVTTAWRCGICSRTAIVAGTALVTATLFLLWLLIVAHVTVGYLAPTLRNAAREILQIAAREETGRQPFQSYTGEHPAIWERVISFAAVALPALGIPFGLWYVWRRYRRNAAVIALGLAALAYPGSQVLRLTRTGGEFATRSPEFLFLAIALLMAIGGVSSGLLTGGRRRGGWLLAGIVSVLLIGGIVTGWGPSVRVLPGAYRVAADSQSIEPEGVATAQWMRQTLGAGNRIGTDRINQLLMGSYGQQYPVTHVADGVNVASVFFAGQLGPQERLQLAQANVRYLVVDLRLSQGLPLFGVYFENGEPDSYQHSAPIDIAALTKFDHAAGISKVFDDGNFAVYDVGALAHEP